METVWAVIFLVVLLLGVSLPMLAIGLFMVYCSIKEIVQWDPATGFWRHTIMEALFGLGTTLAGGFVSYGLGEAILRKISG